MIADLVDINVSLGHWPFQRLAATTARELADHLRREGIVEAWVVSNESILYPDPDGPDRDLFEALGGFDALHPVKTLNLAHPTWRDSLRTGVEAWGARAIRLMPNYHGYELNDYMAAELMREVVRYDVPVLVPLRIEDERNHYPRMQVPAVPAAMLAQLANLHPQVRVVALGAYASELAALAAADNVLVDLAFVEAWDVGTALTGSLPVHRVVFGSHTPFFYTRAARMKLEHCGLPAEQRDAIARANVRHALE